VSIVRATASRETPHSQDANGERLRDRAAHARSPVNNGKKAKSARHGSSREAAAANPEAQKKKKQHRKKETQPTNSDSEPRAANPEPLAMNPRRESSARHWKPRAIGNRARSIGNPRHGIKNAERAPRIMHRIRPDTEPTTTKTPPTPPKTRFALRVNGLKLQKRKIIRNH
jgi:hypothetical protein